MSFPYQPNCSLPKRNIVLSGEDNLSEPNIRREKKDNEEVFIEKKYKLNKELISYISLIEEFWKNKSKIKTQEIWKWQVIIYIL